LIALLLLTFYNIDHILHMGPHRFRGLQQGW